LTSRSVAALTVQVAASLGRLLGAALDILVGRFILHAGGGDAWLVFRRSAPGTALDIPVARCARSGRGGAPEALPAVWSGTWHPGQAPRWSAPWRGARHPSWALRSVFWSRWPSAGGPVRRSTSRLVSVLAVPDLKSRSRRSVLHASWGDAQLAPQRGARSRGMLPSFHCRPSIGFAAVSQSREAVPA
jgi:hypothetical protein